MPDIGALLNQMRADGTLFRVAMNPRAQFGTARRRYIGAELLPERQVEVNQFTEEQIRYRTVVANAGTRYSPSQKKGGALVGTFDVKLAESDIQSELTGRDYDALVRMLQGSGGLMAPSPGSAPIPPSMQATAQIVQFVETVITQALLDVLEVWRWQAMIDKLVKLRGDNEYKEDVAYPSYAPLTFARAADWAVDTNDPMVDIFNIVQAMADRGMVVSRIVTGRTVFSKMAKNALIRARVGRVTVNAAGQLRGTSGLASAAEINNALGADGLPPIELYDLQYRTTTGSQPFLRRDVMAFFATTGRNETLDLGDGIFETLEDTLGYTGIGRAVGQNTPGRVVRVENREDKPPRIFSEGWQTALPVITEPEAIGVITGI